MYAASRVWNAPKSLVNERKIAILVPSKPAAGPQKFLHPGAGIVGAAVRPSLSEAEEAS